MVLIRSNLTVVMYKDTLYSRSSKQWTYTSDKGIKTDKSDKDGKDSPVQCHL